MFRRAEAGDSEATIVFVPHRLRGLPPGTRYWGPEPVRASALDRIPSALPENPMVEQNENAWGWARTVNAVEYLMRRSDARADIFPQDEPRGVIDGPTPDRILVIGEGTAVGLGVLTFELAVAAHFARRHAAVTGRGVEWAALEVPGFRLTNAVSTIDSAESALRDVDVVVIMLGITDTLLLTSRRRWREGMSATLDALLERIPAEATVLVADVSPMEKVVSISRAGRAAGGRHARALNAINRELLESRARCLRVPFPPEFLHQLWRPAGEQTRWSQLYAAWATSMTGALDRR
ncbi:hypothetical protein [Marisediminicola sp. LYQ134]|uniref:hypothetical protein n=1 Tax=Marisediminicola sp. LYQ134 TaxID=3391061 RepID=UPI00398370DE